MSPSSPSDSEPPKRASCDGCFLAKVKCGKEKPICTRCLATGLDCRYSPSARAGKRKSKIAKVTPSRTKATLVTDIPFNNDHLARKMNFTNMSIDADMRDNLFISTEWPTVTGSIDSQRGSLSAGAAPPPLVEDSLSEGESLGSSTPASYQPTFTWQLANHDMSASFPPSHYIPPTRSKSMADMPDASMPWMQNQNGFMAYPESHYSPPPNVYASFYNQNASTSLAPCNCFTACLEALQGLHNHSTTPSMLPSFDVILSVNRRAIECCSAMLSCPSCLRKSGSSTSTMLLATIINQIMTFYRSATQSYFGAASSPAGSNGAGTPSPSLNSMGAPYATQPLLPMSIGAYRLGGEDGRWLEMEVLMRELRKLKEVFARFQEVCASRAAATTNLSNSPPGDHLMDVLGIQTALTNYLGSNLHITLDALNMQKDMVMG